MNQVNAQREQRLIDLAAGAVSTVNVVMERQDSTARTRSRLVA